MKLEYFYKYYTINQNLFSSLINNELYFTNPRNFNDPFDSYPRFNFSSDVSKVIEFYNYLKIKVQEFSSLINSNNENEEKLEEFKNVLKTLSELNLFSEDLYSNEIENFNDKIIELFAFYSDDKILQKLLNANIEFLQAKMYYDYIFLLIDYQKTGISCGSLTPSCPLMWGHYANNHKGMCIKYEFENLSFDNSFIPEILNVNYSDKPIEIFNYSYTELDELRFTILSNKYSKWKYENEIRLIKKGQGLAKINRKSIKEVIFGCKSTPKDRYTILKLFASLGYKIESLKIARVRPDKYELSIQEMKMNDIANSGVHLEELNINKNFR